MALVQIQNPKTGEWKSVDISSEQMESLNKVNDTVIEDDQIISYIDNLKISPEIKAVLDLILNYSMKVGDLILNIGRKIVEVIIYFVQNFPNIIIGTIIGFTIGTIISSIPILGWALGWLILPLSTALGMGMGLKVDIQDKKLANKIKDETSELFGTMKEFKI
jgi:uncharacterized membrane protein YciS (DUF1049 family)